MSVLNAKNNELPFPRQRVTMTGPHLLPLVIIGSMLRDIWRKTMQPAEATGLVPTGSLSLTKRCCLRIERVKETACRI
jgi:hypothetical protein